LKFSKEDKKENKIKNEKMKKNNKSDKETEKYKRKREKKSKKIKSNDPEGTKQEASEHPEKRKHRTSDWAGPEMRIGTIRGYFVCGRRVPWHRLTGAFVACNRRDLKSWVGNSSEGPFWTK
jgi:hypothetical protein